MSRSTHDESDARDSVPPNTYWLSVLVPVYNVAPYLAECMHSILSQIDDGVEIIVLDDASTDGSGQICQEFQKKHASAIKLLSHEDNKGISAVRDALIDAASGERVWFIDSDDTLLPGAMQQLRDIINLHHPDIVLCDYSTERSSRMPTFHGTANKLCSDREELVQGVFRERRLHLWSKIIKRALWTADIRFPAGKLYEDIAVVPDLLLRSTNYYYAPKAWIYYRRRADSIMSQISRRPDTFDDSKNDDLAKALLNFSDNFSNEFARPDPQTSFYISRFCAKEFTKIAHRLLRARLRTQGLNAVSSQLQHYRFWLEKCSPLPFEPLAKEMLRKFQIGQWMILKGWLLIADWRKPAPETDKPAD